MERTLVLIKPDAVQRGLIGEITSRLENKGLKISGMKLMKVSEELAKVYASYAYRIGRRLGLAPPPPAPKTEVDS